MADNFYSSIGLFQTLNAALSAFEFAKKDSVMLKKVKTAYLAEKLKTQNLVS